MISDYSLLSIILGTAMLLSIVLKKLTIAGAVTGALLGLGVYAGAGFTGLAMMGLFFILGTAATAFKREWKNKTGISKKHDSKRTVLQVLANGGVAGLLGLITLFFPQKATLVQVMIAASLGSATADTLSSELGVVFGKRFYNIRTLQKDTRGLDGVVSWEGTWLGIAGSIVIAVIYAVGFGFDKNFLWIVITGTIGNLTDSLLGATLERRSILNNNAVNFLNTFIAAFTAFLLATFF